MPDKLLGKREVVQISSSLSSFPLPPFISFVSFLINLKSHSWLDLGIVRFRDILVRLTVLGLVVFV